MTHTETTAVDHSTMRMMRRGQLVPSRTNPRTHFDPAYLQELAANIKQHRVLQPLLARPLPAARVQDTFEDRQPGEELPTHEIVCGECRWRACGIAEEDEIPVLIRELDDVQVLQVQLVENLKRRDLHPLEEAEGFDRLLKEHHVSIEEIAEKVGKSESYIYKTLKLLELTPESREQMYAGQLTRSVALLVARAPDYLQADIAEEVMTRGYMGGPMTFRQAEQHIQQQHMLKLSRAVFDIKDATLVAKAGACAACAKNTGCSRDMFEDVKDGDTCTDPKCFDAKKVAHEQRVVDAAKAKGQTVIQGKEAKELMPYGVGSLKGYKLLDESGYIDGRTTTVRKAIGKDNVPTPVIIVDPHSNRPMEALPIEVANKLLKKAAGAKKGSAKDAEPSARELEREFNEIWRETATREIGKAILAGRMKSISVAVARKIAAHYTYNTRAEIVCELLGIEDKVGRNDALMDFIETCPADKVAPALLLLMIEDETDCDDNGVIDLLAMETSVDLKAVQAKVQADMKAAAAARKQEQQTQAEPKKPAAKKTPAKKASAEEAKAGIAQALQQAPASTNDFAVGERVRFKMDLKGHDGKARKVSGREGTIHSKIGDRAWSVKYGERAHEHANADYTELERVDAAGDEALATGTIELADGVKLESQPAWPFPKDPNATAPTLETELANAEASGNKYRARMLRKAIGTRTPASTEQAPNAAAAAWPFSTTPKKPRGKGAAS